MNRTSKMVINMENNALTHEHLPRSQNIFWIPVTPPHQHGKQCSDTWTSAKESKYGSWGGGLAYIYILLWIIKSIDCRLHILMEDFWLPKHQTPPKLKFPGNHPCPKLPKLIVRTLTSIQGAARHCIQMPKSQTGRQAPMPSCFSPKLPAPFIKRECTSKTMVFFHESVKCWYATVSPTKPRKLFVHAFCILIVLPHILLLKDLPISHRLKPWPFCHSMRSVQCRQKHRQARRQGLNTMSVSSDFGVERMFPTLPL